MWGRTTLGETKANGLLYFTGRIWVPNRDDLRAFIMNEVHKSRYSIHSVVTKCTRIFVLIIGGLE